MSKLCRGTNDTLYAGEWLTIRAMRRRNGHMPAVEWWEALDKQGKARFLAAAAVVENTLRAGRPPAGRLEKVEGSKVGLLEFRVTPKGGRPPHLRLLVLRRERTLWAANGFTKQKNRLQRADLNLGERIANEWLEEGVEP
ncbi:MAG: hypothetical protein KatS3mg013_1236 [Actinomycetota bacterium]|nr:MAG: hypothetical protein KatS3mg013_1236 [Actinomycetota bacterium]